MPPLHLSHTHPAHVLTPRLAVPHLPVSSRTLHPHGQWHGEATEGSIKDVMEVLPVRGGHREAGGWGLTSA